MQEISSGFDLSHYLSAMTLETRQTGLIDIVPSGWSSLHCPTAQQFKHVYNSRLNKMEHFFDYVNEQRINNISEISEDGKTYCVRGIIKRLQAERVRAFEKGFDNKYAGQKPIYSDADQLEIEDKTGKIKLHISKQTTGFMLDKQITQKDLPSGVCLTITGKFKKKINKFIAKQIYPPEIKINHSLNSEFDLSNKSILVASEPTQQLCLKIRDTINNSISSSSLGITAIVIIGGFKMIVEDIKWIGDFVSDMKDKVDVFVQPSSGDQRHQLFPLKPYNRLFFVQQHQQIGRCSNPQLFQAKNNLKIHISCGQNVKDLVKNSAMPNNDLDVMEMMLRFGHYCPTSPFSLKTQPFLQDYLSIEQVPNVMITGKAITFNSRIVKVKNGEVMLVSVPENQMALVSLNGLSAKNLK